MCISVEDFLLWDSGQQEDRILFFSTVNNLNLLAGATEWAADGTFDIAPPLFAQLYTIHGRVFGAMHPFIYCLLPDKTEATYGLEVT